MAAPIITVVDSNTDKSMTVWNAGVVQQGQKSSVLEITVWNNRNNSTAVSDLQDANITVLDTNGTATSDVVTGKWVTVRAAKLGGNSYTPIGGSTAYKFAADGLASASNTNFTIKGNANGGSLTTDTNNYAKLVLRISVPTNATGGIRNVKARISGYYT